MAASAQQPVVRVTARLVEVDVVALDKSSRAVTGLAAEDFALLEDGRPQAIRFFSASAPTSTPVRAPAQAPTLADGKPLPPDTYSNRAVPSSAPPGVTAILIDALNTSYTNQAYARDRLVEFLRKLTPGDRLALYALGSHGLRLLHGFTDDPSELVRLLTDTRDWSSWLGDSPLTVPDHVFYSRAPETLRALAAIADHLAQIPGRKNLLWLSATFPVLFSNWVTRGPVQFAFADELGHLARHFSNAGMALYPVDARGLVPDWSYNAQLASHVRFRSLFTRMNPVKTSIEGMQILAANTGGRAFYNSNDLETSFRRAVEDARSVYVLGYAPPAQDWDGRFRRIEVTVNRPETALLHRRGYFATDAAKDNGRRKSLLADTLQSPLAATRLGMTAQLVRGGDGGEWKLRLRVEPGNLTLEKREREWTGRLEVHYAQQKADGTHGKIDEQSLDMTLPEDLARKVMRQGLLLTHLFRPRPGVTRMRIVAFDLPSGAFGSLDVPLGEPGRADPVPPRM